MIRGLFLNMHSDPGRRAGVPVGRAVFDGRCELHESRHCVIEELLVTFAEIIISILDTRFSMLVCLAGAYRSMIEYRASGIENPILQAAAPAEIEMSANQTLVAELLLVPCERPFFSVGRELLYRRFEDITQSPLWFDKELATKDIACMLDYDKAGALFAVGADRMFA